MLGRFLGFAACLLAGGLAGYLLQVDADLLGGRLMGVVLGAFLWFLVDTRALGRLQRWLAVESPDNETRHSGIWGELASRMRRLLRERDRAIAEGKVRLDDVLAAFQASPNGVVLLNREWRIEWFNRTASSHFGFDERRDLLQSIGNLVRDPGFARYLAERDFSGMLTMPGRDSSLSRPVVLSVQMHPYGSGRMLLLSRDITALQQAEAMRRDFVANVSHEIRTPLTVLAGFVETLQTLDLDEAERQHYLQMMAQQSDRMQTLVSDLLTLSRLEGSPPPDLDAWHPLVPMLAQLRHDALALSQLVCAKAGVPQQIHFEIGFSGDLSGSASELLSAMGNLVSNAVRYTPPGARIDVSLMLSPAGHLQFAVSDNGPGIAPEHLGRLTERFYRVDTSRSRDSGGTGLGLAIVKHVVQRHGANLSIDSTPGKGSTFRITFPVGRFRAVAQSD